MTKVKICGITNIDDALVAAEAGADFLGFILYPPSKRGVDEKQVQSIVSHLRRLAHCPTLVGVFVSESAEKVQQTLDFCDLDLAQLHGNEPPKLIGDADSLLYGRAYKAIRPQVYEEAEADAEWFVPPDEGQYSAEYPELMIDAYHPDLYGGTGETSDWAMAAKVNESEYVSRLMLAGGLNPGNVAQAIREVRPWAVDIASGVEASPGKKDHDAVRAFVRAAKEGI